MHPLPILFFYFLCSMCPCPFTAQFFFCAFQLLHSDPSSCMNHLQRQHPQQLQQQQQPNLFFVPCTYSFYAPCACNIRHSSACSYHANFLHISSALPDHHRNSSTSLVVPTMRPTSLGVLLRFLNLSGQLRLFIFSGTVELILYFLVTDFNAHPPINPSKNRLPSLDEAWRLFISSGDHTEVSSNSLAETINGF
jgi:hypothetical protein